MFTIKLRASNRKELTDNLENLVLKLNLDYAGFVAKTGSSAGRPLIYYPEDLQVQKELCGKTVGIVQDITNLKVSFTDRFSEVILSDTHKFLFLKEIIPAIVFYSLCSKRTQIWKVRRYIKKNFNHLQEIFKGE